VILEQTQDTTDNTQFESVDKSAEIRRTLLETKDPKYKGQ
jgi:hypothetical protein